MPGVRYDTDPVDLEPLRMIWNLHQKLGIPPESLVKPPASSGAA